MPEVFKKHYANRPFSNDEYVVEGHLNVECSGPIKFLAPLLRWMGSIPPENEQYVPVKVIFRSEPDSKDFVFDREFCFSSRRYCFHSKMRQVSGDQVVEIMKFGIIWKMQYLWDKDRVRLRHSGYGLHLFGKVIPLPLGFLIGGGDAEEVAVDDLHFDMCVAVTHPLWGKIYRYSGRFEVKS